MPPDQQDAKTARKLAQLNAEALSVQAGFSPGTAEHCLAAAVVRAVGMAGLLRSHPTITCHPRDTQAKPDTGYGDPEWQARWR